MTEGVRRYDIPVPRLWETLRPTSAPWAVSTGIRAIVSSAIIALAGVAFGNSASIGVAYFAATMSTLFAVGGFHRARLTAMLGQAVGAVIGIVVGSVTPNTLPIAVVVAAAVAMVGGMVAAIDPAFSAFSLLLVVGTAYGQFGGSPLSVTDQCLWYLIGSAIVAAIVAAESITVVPRRERQDISALLASNAAVLDALGGPGCTQARRDLADTAAVCRATLYSYRLTLRRGTYAVDAIEAAAQAARRVTLVVISLYAKGAPAPPGASAIVRSAAADVAEGRVIAVRGFDTHPDPGLSPIVAALTAPARHPSLDDTESATPPTVPQFISSTIKTAMHRTSLGSGLRLAMCVAVATAGASALHGEHHAFWLVLTVGVVVRPELQSVFVRVINRIAGSIIGAVVAAAILLTGPDDWVLALCAAISMGLSALAAPKIYGLFVIGITSSTLLSASIGEVNRLAPELRLLDTLLGCTVAVVIGYVLWPGKLFATHTPLENAKRSTVTYLRAAADPKTQPLALGALRRRAYDDSHGLRRNLQSAVLEPNRLSPTVRTELPIALALEDVADDISDLAFTVAKTGIAPAAAEIDEIAGAIMALGPHSATHPGSALLHIGNADGPLVRMRATLVGMSGLVGPA
ncbi:FUSC family protein [Antrihabitans spumae]|uniref:FUSC family protein n=1 Tax=Antrihabitans spumae TaxID=3373370 RepID=A0ABW7KB94_9NOCA